MLMTGQVPHKTEVDLDLNYSIECDYVNTKTVEITWDYQFEVRSWGIKNVSITVPNQEIVVDVDVYENDESENTVKKNIVLKVENVEIEGTPSLPLAPTSLVYENGVWKLHF